MALFLFLSIYLMMYLNDSIYANTEVVVQHSQKERVVRHDAFWASYVMRLVVSIFVIGNPTNFQRTPWVHQKGIVDVKYTASVGPRSDDGPPRIHVVSYKRFFQLQNSFNQISLALDEFGFDFEPNHDEEKRRVTIGAEVHHDVVTYLSHISKAPSKKIWENVAHSNVGYIIIASYVSKAPICSNP